MKPNPKCQSYLRNSHQRTPFIPGIFHFFVQESVVHSNLPMVSICKSHNLKAFLDRQKRISGGTLHHNPETSPRFRPCLDGLWPDTLINYKVGKKNAFSHLKNGKQWFCPQGPWEDTVEKLPQNLTLRKKFRKINCWWNVGGIFQGYMDEISEWWLEDDPASFWVPVYFQGRTVKLPGGYFSRVPPCHCTMFWGVKEWKKSSEAYFLKRSLGVLLLNIPDFQTVRKYGVFASQSVFGRFLTLQGTNISPKNGILKMIFLFPRWDMLIPWRVSLWIVQNYCNA